MILKHLNAYVAKNTFDYFIHKDLAAFLSRELDFYIKNEIFHIDNIETENEQRNQIFFAKIRTIKKVARILIDFLAQIENFQKKLWLKKKFVFETNYCISLDLIDESFYPEIAANEAQTEDWIKNFAIDEIPSNLVTPAFSRPLTVDFLKAHTNLVVDTGYFSRSFTDRLISCYHNIDSRINGVLIDSDNFHALNLFISAKYLNKIDAVISDPPYNTGDDGFLYKDNYKHSSWLAMMSSRMQLIYPLLKDGGWMSLNINDIELYNLFKLLEEYNWSTLNSILWD